MLSTIRTKLPTLIILLIAMTANSFGDVLLSRTMNNLGAIEAHCLADGLAIAQQVLSQGVFWISILCLTLFFGLWSYLLGHEDVSYIMPLTAVTYVISALLAGPMLGEQVSFQRWAGTFIIVIGVAIVAGTGKENNVEKDPSADVAELIIESQSKSACDLDT